MITVLDSDGPVVGSKRDADGSFKDIFGFKANDAAISGLSVEAVDWNEDGLLDLIVNDSSKLKLYVNQGTKEQYVYADYSVLKADNAVISYKSTYLHVYDLDGDEKKDLLVGVRDSSENKIYFYQNIGTNGSPLLNKGVPLYTKDNQPIMPVNASGIYFTVTDWNEDGCGDILVTDYQQNNGKFDILVKLYHGQDITDIAAENSANETVPAKHWWEFRNRKCVFTYALDRKQAVSLQIVSVNGKVVREYRRYISGTGALSLDLSTVASGLYLLHYRIDNTMYSQKIVVK